MATKPKRPKHVRKGIVARSLRKLGAKDPGDKGYPVLTGKSKEYFEGTKTEKYARQHERKKRNVRKAKKRK
jgi:hypothetical protein